MRFVDKSDISRVLTIPQLVAALEAAHRRPRIEIQDGFLGSEAAHYFVRHAVDPGRFMASKLITSFPSNLSGGRLPAVQAICVIFDGKDGHPLAAIDGTEITYWRTAANSALGAKLLAPSDPQVLLAVGAGGLSERLVHAHRAVHPSIRRVLVWNRTASRAGELAERLKAQGIDAAVVHDLDAATREADVICTATRSHEPLIKGANLKRGAHLDLVGGYTRDNREADDEAARRSRIFVDRRETAFETAGDILQPIASGAIRAADVLGDLYDLAGDQVRWRRGPDDITLYKNAGGGHLDLMTCEVVLKELGVVERSR